MNFIINLFVHPDTGELRSGWQVTIFFMVFLIMAGLIAVPLTTFVVTLLPPPMQSQWSALTFNKIGMLLAAVAATLFCRNLFPQVQFTACGYSLSPRWWVDIVGGSLAGIGLLSLVLGLTVVVQKATLQVATVSVALLGWALIQGVILFLIAAAFEEVLLRGFAFQTLKENTNPLNTLLVTSGLFALIHIANPHSTSLALLNTFLAGIWLGVARLKRPSLWLATGLHLGWNFATVWVWGVSVSGLDHLISTTVLTTQPLSPQWLTGGSYGPEGGILCTISLCLATFWMARRLQQVDPPASPS